MGQVTHEIRNMLNTALLAFDVVKRGTGVLQLVLHVGALPASIGSLGERGGALFRGKGRKSHAYVTSDVELSDTDR